MNTHIGETGASSAWGKFVTCAFCINCYSGDNDFENRSLDNVSPALRHIADLLVVMFVNFCNET